MTARIAWAEGSGLDRLREEPPQTPLPVRKRRTIVLLILIGLCLLGGLGVLGFRWLTQEPNYGPISEKSRWTYAVEYRVLFGSVQKGKAVVRVDGTESINGNRYYKVVTVFSGIPGVEPQIEYVRVSKDGAYVVWDKSKPESLATPAALSVGTTWTVEKGDSHLDYRVEAMETAELFDKKYENCLKVSYKGTVKGRAVKGYQYYAPGVGLVKEFVDASLVTMEWALEKYEK